MPSILPSQASIGRSLRRCGALIVWLVCSRWTAVVLVVAGWVGYADYVEQRFQQELKPQYIALTKVCRTSQTALIESREALSQMHSMLAESQDALHKLRPELDGARATLIDSQTAINELHAALNKSRTALAGSQTIVAELVRQLETQRHLSDFHYAACVIFPRVADELFEHMGAAQIRMIAGTVNTSVRVFLDRFELPRPVLNTMWQNALAGYCLYCGDRLHHGGHGDDGTLGLPITPEHLQAAQRWLDEHELSVASLRMLPTTERAKLLNFYTYRYCRFLTTGPVRYDDLNDIYKLGTTECGGFCYFYRGLAEVLGLQTRHMRLINIPNQGNHVGIEVRNDDGDWSYFDPTFGIYFTADGKPESEPLCYRNILALRPHVLRHHVVQVNRDAPLVAHFTIEAFDGSYDHEFMPIENYLKPEVISHDDPDELVAIGVPLSLASGRVELGDFSQYDRSGLQQGWLIATNATLNDDDPNNDTSYNAAEITNAHEDKLTVLSFDRLTPNRHYSLELRLFSMYDAPQPVQLISFGRGFIADAGEPLTIVKGAVTVRKEFQARSERGQICLRHLSSGGLVEMFAVRMTEIPASFDLAEYQPQRASVTIATKPAVEESQAMEPDRGAKPLKNPSVLNAMVNRRPASRLFRR